MRRVPTVGILHPGEMGAALAGVLAQRTAVLWASDGRSAATRRRAEAAGLQDAGSVAQLAARSDVAISVCPPHAALAVAETMAGFGGIYVDANAVAPTTCQTIASCVEAGGATYVDAGIIGPPPQRAGTTRIYLSGAAAEDVAGIFAGSALEPIVLDGPAGAASALKLAYAAWSKGAQALLLVSRALARAGGVEDALAAEWEASQPELPERARYSAYMTARKGWRWIGEMNEIVRMLEDAELPAGFHEAAAELFGRVPRAVDVARDDANVDRVVALLTAREGSVPA
jgi:3-hydroxyisobutyrate dehydrogenase-like beta-hydroxyacid dehydrogenase